MRVDQLTQLATQLRNLADRLDTEGPTALQRAHDWQRGPRPGDTHNTPPQPGDPDYTGPTDLDPDAALTNDQLDDRRADELAHRTLTHLTRTIHALTRNTTRLDALLTLLRTITPNHTTPTNDGCRSCARTGKHEPIATRPDGRPRYPNLCRFCGDWATAHNGTHPPLPLIRWRHQHPGRHVTTAVLRQLGLTP